MSLIQKAAMFVGVAFWGVVVMMAAMAAADQGWSDDSCYYKGELDYDDMQWHGFLLNFSIAETGQMEFEASFDKDKCCPSLLIYSSDQVAKLNANMTCEEKKLITSQDNVILLNVTTDGCAMKADDDDEIMCKGTKMFQQGTNQNASWYVAVSNCGAQEGLDLELSLNTTGKVSTCKKPETSAGDVAGVHSVIMWFGAFAAMLVMMI